MRVILVSGFGPTHKNDRYVADTLFDWHRADHVSRTYFAGRDGFALRELSFEHDGRRYPLMRPRDYTVPHLTTVTLEAILRAADIEYATVDTSAIWRGVAEVPDGRVDAVLLSTTFIWDQRTMARAIDWIGSALPGVPVILGGQYSNLKYLRIMTSHPRVTAIVRDDGEVALPAALRTIHAGADLSGVPNLVHRDPRDPTVVRHNAIGYVDLETYPSPAFSGAYPSVPYESMRGCPFTCKFCSYPMATQRWRVKSAQKIVKDWLEYVERNATSFVKAMDSTFTVPPARMRKLFEILPSVGVEWEAYSRANVIIDERYVANLARSGCRTLSIGFESMSDQNLLNMDKKVTAHHNRRAVRLLRGSPVGYRCSFMVGYPGETPSAYQTTHDYLVEEFAGHFKLSVFGMSDETMPLWADQERFGIEMTAADDPDYAWRHIGMDSATAFELNHRTLDAVRARNDDAVLIIWQDYYQRWLLPHVSRTENLRIEKTVERIAMLPRDHPDPARGMIELDRLLDTCARWGITRTDPATHCGDPLITD